MKRRGPLRINVRLSGHELRLLGAALAMLQNDLDQGAEAHDAYCTMAGLTGVSASELEYMLIDLRDKLAADEHRANVREWKTEL